jgi:hypothetical protein
MKNLFLLIAFTVTACGQNSNLKKPDILPKSPDLIYEYIYPYNTPDLIENHYINLSISNNGIKGYYYGTSDEFDEAREGYLPAFFVSKMDNLIIKNDTIKFKLTVDNSDFLTQTVDLKYKTTNDALSAGYKNWENKIPTSPKTYTGVFQNSETIVFKVDQDIRVFKKKNK